MTFCQHRDMFANRESVLTDVTLFNDDSMPDKGPIPYIVCSCGKSFRLTKKLTRTASFRAIEDALGQGTFSVRVHHGKPFPFVRTNAQGYSYLSYNAFINAVEIVTI